MKPFALALALLIPSSASAGSIWEFQGVTGSPFISEIPVGTPLTIAWTPDSSTNLCGPTGPGLYGDQAVTVTLGAFTYQATGYLQANSTIDNICFAFSPDMELRLLTWLGPSFPDARLGGFFDTPPGLFFSRFPFSHAFPTDPPLTALWTGPEFLTPSGPAALWSSVHFVPDPPAVPEPASLVLMGVGLLGMRCALRKSR